MTFVALQPATSPKARDNVKRTLKKPTKLAYLRKFLDEDEFEKLKKIYPDGKVFVWGVKVERYPQWEKIIAGVTLVLFRQGDRVACGAIVTHKLWNEELAEYLWGEDDDGELWSLIYFVTNPKPLDIPASDASKAAGLNPSWNWQGFVVISSPEADAVLKLAGDNVK